MILSEKQRTHHCADQAPKNDKQLKNNRNQFKQMEEIQQENTEMEHYQTNECEQAVGNKFLQFIEESGENENKYENHNLQSMQTLREKYKQKSMPRLNLIKPVMTPQKIQINPLFSNTLIFSNFKKVDYCESPQKTKNFRSRSLKTDSMKKIPRIQIGSHSIDRHEQIKGQSFSIRDKVRQTAEHQNKLSVISPLRNKPKCTLFHGLYNNSQESKKLNYLKLTKNEIKHLQDEAIQKKSRITKMPSLNVSPQSLKSKQMKKKCNSKSLEVSLLIATDLQFLRSVPKIDILDYLQKLKTEEVYRKIVNVNKWNHFQYSYQQN